MDFASDFILVEEEEEEIIEPSHLSQEAAAEDEGYHYGGDNSEFECEIMDFDEDEDTEERKDGAEAPKDVKAQKVNTNTVKLEMKKLKEEPDVKVEKSKLVKCKAEMCGAVYSHIAKKDDEKKVWTCNFCHHENVIDVELPDLADKSDVMYVDDTCNIPELIPAESSKQKIIFVIDTSSSMCQTKNIDITTASQTLKDILEKDKKRQAAIQQQLLNLADVPPVGPAITSSKVEVTRLQAIKASVTDAIDKLVQSQPETRVGLVTFHEGVDVYGDGSKCINVQDSKLLDKTGLEKIGQDERNLCPVRESAVSLKEKIEILDELGRTALGPALVIAQSMAGDAEGSKIIMCTDGVANIGLGRLEDTTDDEINKFYNEIINASLLSGVSITLLCVDNAGLDKRLGQVPSETGGLLEKIQATELDAKLTDALKTATVAVNTDIKFIVHKDLYVHDTKEPDSKRNTCLQKVGNLQLDKSVSFRFALKPNNPQEQPPPQSQDTENGDQSLPFQVIVQYRTLAGACVVRVWTSERKVTKIRAQAEDAMNPKTTVENFLQQSCQKLLEDIFAKKYLVDQANKFSQEGQKLLSNDKIRQLGAVESKLRQFLSIMLEIERNHRPTEEQIVQLNSIKDSRSSGVKG
ncbi:hypothetical protein BsWGS_12264 [Bradybaena similaris]